MNEQWMTRRHDRPAQGAGPTHEATASTASQELLAQAHGFYQVAHQSHQRIQEGGDALDSLRHRAQRPGQ